MPGEIDALISLLEDDSATVITAVEDRLKELVPESLSALREAQEAESAKVRGRARELLRGLSFSASIDRLIELAETPHPDVEEMALWMARLQNPALSFDHVRDELDAISERAALHLEEVEAGRPRLEAFLHFIHKKEGFKGDTEDLLAYVNNFISTVIDRRCGMPITLILVYILVGKRIGLRIDAIGSPNRALAFYRDETFETYIDAFSGGNLHSHYECLAFFKRIGLKPSYDPRDLLRRLSSREVIERMTRNLINFCNNDGRTTESAELRRLAQALVRHRDKDT